MKTKMKTVAISLPEPLLEDVEEQFGEHYASRSEMFRKILREFLKQQVEDANA